MVNSSAAEPVQFSVTPEGFRDLFARTAAFDENQARLMRRNIRSAALSVVSDIQANLRNGSYKTDAGMRQGISDGLKVSVSTVSKSRPGVRIIATKGKMPAGKAPMVRAWQRQTFRHPVFGNSAVFVDQQGHPYFDATIEAHRDKVTQAVNEAMKQAAATLAGAPA